MENKFKNFDSKTPLFSLEGMNTFGRVVDVIDGDTLHVVIPLFDKYYKFIVRLIGIDTCETNSDNIDVKNKALQAKYRVIELLLPNKKINEIMGIPKKQIKQFLDEYVSIVWIEFGDFDKYGRALANISIKENSKLKSLSTILFEEKLAYKYDGDKKPSEEEQLNLLNIRK